MRIIAGEFKGRNIKSPSEETTRPTTDRVRESMFSSVLSRTGDLDGAHVLDAFGGSGALGLEALSRGAQQCTFFEQDAAARKVLEGNVASFGLDSRRARVNGKDVFAAVAHPLTYEHAFDLVTLDPPYAIEPARVFELLDSLADNGDIAAGTVIAYEHKLPNREVVEGLAAASARYELTGQKKYGKIAVSYLEVSGDD